MPEEFSNAGEPQIVDRSFGGWRVVAAAWAVVIVALVAFAGVQAVASRLTVSPSGYDYSGVMIPRHDASCSDLDPVTASVTQSCPADTESGIERAEASYYGW
ncbi:MAG TPA: hypothetical protein VMF05_04230 [Stellaceae bacterium]|nr:hypothetical protein [Stellaceae bacterium]